MPVANKHLDDLSDVPQEMKVFIQRPTRWANPYSTKRGRHIIAVVATRDEAIELYRQYLWERIKDGTIPLEDLADLHGKYLICGCSPKSCHGDVLEKAAEWAARKLGRIG